MVTAGRLREIIRKYGKAGVVLVGVYLVGHHWWTKRRSALLASVVALLFGLSVLGYGLWGGEREPGPVPKRITVRRVLPPVAAAPPIEREAYRPRRSLLAHARRVTALDAHFCDLFWASTERLLLVTSTRPTHAYGDMEANTWTGDAAMLNVRTGQRHKMAGLTRVFHRMHATPGKFEVSPGGTWLLWTNYMTADGWPNPAVARWDGSGFQQLCQDKGSHLYWLDGHRWVEERVYPLDHPEQREDIVHDLELRTELRVKQHSKQGQRISHSPYAASRSNFLTDWKEDTTADSVKIFVGRFCGTDGIDEEDFSGPAIPMPAGADLRQILVSQVTHRVLYVFHFPQAAHPRKGRSSYGVFDVWTSQLDGSGLREIGYVDAPKAKEDEGEWNREMHSKALSGLVWLPDGVHFSFISRGELYLARSL